MTNFRCKRCNYQFNMQLESNKLPRSCPNCGERESVLREQTAQDLLEESN
ncbi:hypothetical protein HYW74_03045 [Candidatus Pacearchaeota archaeon]|nr:hypothetical protein [Candidatus Pacearchaeota archaeon]